MICLTMEWLVNYYLYESMNSNECFLKGNDLGSTYFEGHLFLHVVDKFCFWGTFFRGLKNDLGMPREGSGKL